MDFVRLGPAYSTSFEPDMLIKGYSSLIWAERFTETPGDFQLRTPHIEKMAQLLPEDTLVSHLETEDVHQVDTHTIEEDERGIRELVITGRSLTTFPEHRHIYGPYGEKFSMTKAYSPLVAAAVLLWNALDNPTDVDVVREDDIYFGEVGGIPPGFGEHKISTRDRVDNIAITDSSTSDGKARRWWLKEGPLYPQLVSILAKADIGLRVIRPSRRSSGVVITVKTGKDVRGDIVRENRNPINSLRFDLYTGLDRTVNQRVNPRVEFNYLRGHFDSGSYLFSNKGYKSIMEIMTGYAPGVVSREGEGSFTGLKRKIASVDYGRPKIPDAPQPPDELKKGASKQERERRQEKMDDYLDRMKAWRARRERILENFKEDSREDALADLKRQKRVSVFSGDISPLSPYVYRKDYNLGDLVTLYGDYGQVETMMVGEFIRTEDSSGDFGIPTLMTP